MPTDIVLVGAVDVLDSVGALQAVVSAPLLSGPESAA
jgi:hypothetical protein